MNESILGVYGLGVMGSSIAQNLLKHGYNISVYSKDLQETEKFRLKNIENVKVFDKDNIDLFLKSLEKPKKVFLMITAGEVVDKVIEELLNYLEPGDIIIDGGNSFYKDTNRRYEYLKKKGLDYIGVGISGGEKGALNGPSMMPSGEADIYKKVENIFNDISAKSKDNKPCCTYIGKEGAGHYVKMVHNGIEYADIEIICEAYLIMKNICGLGIEKIQKIFEKWNKGPLKSYLIEITANILKKKDEETGKYLVEVISDRAGQKGTGKWTAVEGLEMNVPIPSVVEAVFARSISDLKEKRIEAEKKLKLDKMSGNIGSEDIFIHHLAKAVYLSHICSYAQGFDLLSNVSKKYGWNLNLEEIALIWREGCIIKAEFLEEIASEFKNEKIENLMLGKKFSKELIDNHTKWRDVVCKAIKAGIYIPGMSSALEYFDGYRNSESSANLLQAQRDYFGAHTYERNDKKGHFHTEWE